MGARKRKSAPSEIGRVDASAVNKAKAAASRKQKKDKQNKAKGSKHGGGGLHQMTIRGVVVLVVAIVSSLVLNHRNANKEVYQTNHVPTYVEPSFGAFWAEVCGNSKRTTYGNKAWCGGGKIEPSRRTLQAKSKLNPVKRGEVVAEIPRALQIWELDALTSDLVKTRSLLTARHELTKHSLASGAYLAVYLADERKRLLGEDESDDGEEGGADGTSNPVVQGEPDELRALYFRSLPTFKELSDFHPLLKSRNELKDMLRHHSWNYAVVVMYQEMIDSEYKALAAVSPLGFGKHISIKDYQTARIHVLSRSFNPGSDACSAEAEKQLSPDEIRSIRTDWDIPSSEPLFGEGCHAMVPILDTLNSHPRPNVVYKYDSEKEAFVITAKTSIDPQWEVMNSYGKFSDPHLYAKFGFVTGDGSGYTQASIALYHRPLDYGIAEYTLVPKKVTDSYDDDSTSPLDKIPVFQKKNLKRYLAFDDGYDYCVQQDLHPEAFRLKQLKLVHLAKIANNPKAWITTVGPRDKGSRPRKSSDLLISPVPPQMHTTNLNMDITPIVETCRLLALTVDDFDGNAIQVLEDNVGNSTFVVNDPGNEALEYRSLMFLGRMSGNALLQYPIEPKKEFENAFDLNKKNAFGTSEWTASHLRLGEMQTLKILAGSVINHAQRMLKTPEQAVSAAYNSRDKSCNPEYTDILEWKTE